MVFCHRTVEGQKKFLYYAIFVFLVQLDLDYSNLDFENATTRSDRVSCLSAMINICVIFFTSV